MNSKLSQIISFFSRSEEKSLEKQKIFALVKEIISNINTPANWHPLGFFHLKLGSLPTGENVRLHIWSKFRRDPQIPEWMIHNHIFTLDSYILAGCVTNHLYELHNDVTSPTNRIYSVIYNQNTSILKRTAQTVTCKKIEVTDYCENSFYRVESSSFHSTTVSTSNFAATIVLTTETSKVSPIVLGDLTGDDEYRYERRYCDREVFESLLNELSEETNFAFIN